MNIGNYKVHTASSGLFRLDGGAMFGVVPKVLWEKQHSCDEKNRIYMCTNLLLIQGEGKNILVDTGTGSMANDKMGLNYAIDNSVYSLEGFLSEQGLGVEDISDVILTHLHFDHAGGAVRPDDRKIYVPTFPRARYHVQKKQFEWASNPTRRDRESYRTSHFFPLKESGQLNLLDGPGILYPGIELLTFEGHTPGQQLPLLRGNGTSLFYALHPLQTLKEKETILPRIVEENWIVVFEHDPLRPQGTLEVRDGTYILNDFL